MVDENEIPSLGVPLEKNEEDQRKVVLTNIIKMLINRRWLEKTTWNMKKIEKFVSNKSENDIYIINLDTDISKHLNNKQKNKKKEENEQYNINQVYVKLIDQNVLNSSSTTLLTDFLKSHKDNYKIIVVNSITDKLSNSFLNLDVKIEIFEKVFLLIDLLSVFGSSEYEVLDNESKELFFKEYSVNFNQTAKLLLSDPASKYFDFNI